MFTELKGAKSTGNLLQKPSACSLTPRTLRPQEETGSFGGESQAIQDLRGLTLGP